MSTPLNIEQEPQVLSSQVFTEEFPAVTTEELNEENVSNTDTNNSESKENPEPINTQSINTIERTLSNLNEEITKLKSKIADLEQMPATKSILTETENAKKQTILKNSRTQSILQQLEQLAPQN